MKKTVLFLSCLLVIFERASQGLAFPRGQKRRDDMVNMNMVAGGDSGFQAGGGGGGGGGFPQQMNRPQRRHQAGTVGLMRSFGQGGHGVSLGGDQNGGAQVINLQELLGQSGSIKGRPRGGMQAGALRSRGMPDGVPPMRAMQQQQQPQQYNDMSDGMPFLRGSQSKDMGAPMGMASLGSHSQRFMAGDIMPQRMGGQNIPMHGFPSQDFSPQEDNRPINPELMGNAGLGRHPSGPMMNGADMFGQGQGPSGMNLGGMKMFGGGPKMGSMGWMGGEREQQQGPPGFMAENRGFGGRAGGMGRQLVGSPLEADAFGMGGPSDYQDLDNNYPMDADTP